MSHSQTTPTAQLDRGLTLSHTISLVVGTVIGTGVFLKATVMAQTVGSPSLVLWAWVLAGLLSMAGALTYAELGGLLPRAGGEYAYLLEAYGEGTAFLYGWMRFVMGSAGSIASLAVGFATFLAAMLPINHLWAEYTYHAFGQTLVWRFGTQQVLALGVIVLLSALNCGRVVLG
ncbi:MAG TPA: amino acid permease, partial [Terriglobales bacterium]|nr:amino acid permease [Terriglobales bacterium]